MSRPRRIAYGQAPSQVGDLWLPGSREGKAPVVVLVHGGFWRAQFGRDLMTGLARSVVGRGYAAWNIEYRRTGRLAGGGGWPNTFTDVADALGYLAGLEGVDLERVVTCGHSAGGHLALWVAQKQPPEGSPLDRLGVTIRGAVSLAGVVDLAMADRLGLGGDATAGLLGAHASDSPDVYRLASPSELLPLGVPQVLMHGIDDHVVPAIMSEQYAAKATQAGDSASYLGFAGAGHREMIDPGSLVWARALDEIEALLASP